MKVFKTELIRDQFNDEDELSQLVADFKRYKETGVPPTTFGRDALYDHPHNLSSVRQAELRHLHILSREHSLNANCRNQYHRTSDDHLVYCEGFYEQNEYLLIALLSPDAHERARSNNVMTRMAEMAEKFRNEH